MKIPRKIKKQIPKNTPYCYVMTSGIIYPETGLSYYNIKTCPFYKFNKDEGGYCNLIKYEILDQIKYCGISDR